MRTKLLFLLLLLSSFGSALFKDAKLSLSPAEIRAGDPFTVNLTLVNASKSENLTRIHVEIWVDDTLVFEKTEELANLSAGENRSFSYPSGGFNDWWRKGLMNFDCGTHEVRVEISGAFSWSKAVYLEIEGYYFETVKLTPEKPDVKRRIVVYVEDVNGKAFSGVNVRFTHLGANEKWDVDDRDVEKKTGKDGTASFNFTLEFGRRGLHAKYKLDVWKSGYCGFTQELDLRKQLQVVVLTEDPRVNRTMKLKVTDEEERAVPEAMVTISGPAGYLRTFESDYDGLISFTPPRVGIYSAIASKEGYRDSEIVSFEVRMLGKLELSVSPTEVEVGSPVRVAVTCEGKPVGGVTVILTLPDGGERRLLTNEKGEVSYSAESLGAHSILATKEDYEPARGNFLALNVFQVEMERSRFLVDEDITLRLRDRWNRPVAGAYVSIVGTTISGLSDEKGGIRLRAEGPGKVRVAFTKAGFKERFVEVEVYGKLSIKLSATELRLGEELSIDVLDERGRRIAANLTVLRPDGTNVSVAPGSYKPEMAGSYVVSVGLPFYEPANLSFHVQPLEAQLDAWISGNKLFAKVLVEGKPADGVLVSFKWDREERVVRTDEEGLASISLEGVEAEEFNVSVVDRNYRAPSRLVGRARLPIHLLLLVAVVLIGAACYLGYSYLKRPPKVPPKTRLERV